MYALMKCTLLYCNVMYGWAQAYAETRYLSGYGSHTKGSQLSAGIPCVIHQTAKSLGEELVELVVRGWSRYHVRYNCHCPEGFYQQAYLCMYMYVDARICKVFGSRARSAESIQCLKRAEWPTSCCWFFGIAIQLYLHLLFAYVNMHPRNPHSDSNMYFVIFIYSYTVLFRK